MSFSHTPNGEKTLSSYIITLFVRVYHFSFVFLFQLVREAKDSAQLSPGVAKLLDRIADYPNVPRKKAKFEVSL